MEQNSPNGPNRNVTLKEVWPALLVVALLFVLIYFREMGETWAIALFALVFGGVKIYGSLPAAKQKKDPANKKAQEDLQSNRAWRWFRSGILLVVFALVCIGVLAAFVK